jgi:hypothetical protein
VSKLIAQQPQACDGNANGSKNRLSGEAAEPVADAKRMDGCNRVCELLAPAGAGEEYRPIGGSKAVQADRQRRLLWGREEKMGGKGFIAMGALSP